MGDANQSSEVSACRRASNRKPFRVETQCFGMQVKVFNGVIDVVDLRWKGGIAAQPIVNTGYRQSVLKEVSDGDTRS